MQLHGAAKAVYAQLPACEVPHNANLKQIRTHWNSGCALLLAEARLREEDRISIISAWLDKAGLGDFVVGKMLANFARPLPAPPSEEQKKERFQKALVRSVYKDDIPHMKDVIETYSERLEDVPHNTTDSLAKLDKEEEREKANPGTMFAEFAKRISAKQALRAPSAGNGASPHVAAE